MPDPVDGNVTYQRKHNVGSKTYQNLQNSFYYTWTNALTENIPVSGASLKRAENFFGYFDIFGHPKSILERLSVCMTFCFLIIT